MDRLRVFLSSGGVELSEERDTVAAFLTALAHHPLRYEDFAYDGVSGREACRRGVENSDALILILGARYGEFLADSGISPAEEEYNRAKEVGRMILAFKQRAERFDPSQREFLERVEAERRTRCVRDFSGPLDLAEGVLEQFDELKAREALHWEPVGREPPVRWLSDRIGELPGGAEGYPMLELYLAADGDMPSTSVAELSAMGDRLVLAARDAGFFGGRDVIQTGYDSRNAWAIRTGPEQPKSWSAVIGHPYAGVFFDREGGLLVFQSLPRDTFGTLVDSTDLKRRLATLLEATKPLTRTMRRVVPVAALEPADLVGLGDPAKMGNRGGRGDSLYWQGPIRSGASTGLDAMDFRSGAEDVATQLAARLVERLAGGPAQFQRL
jgi:hypothetical protein